MELLRFLFPLFTFDADDGGGEGGTATKTDDADKGDDKGDDDRSLADKGSTVFDQDKADDDDGPEGESEADKFKRRQRQADRRAAKAAKERDEALAKLKEREQADESEREKHEREAKEATERATKLEQKARKANLRAAIADSEHKVASVADTATLLLNSDVEIEWNDENEPVDLDDKLGTFLESRSHLTAKSATVSGGSDAGKGSGGSTSLEEMSVDDHLKRIQGKTD